MENYLLFASLSASISPGCYVVRKQMSAGLAVGVGGQSALQFPSEVGRIDLLSSHVLSLSRKHRSPNLRV